MIDHEKKYSFQISRKEYANSYTFVKQFSKIVIRPIKL